jgi:SAM-dependent methyltransferase
MSVATPASARALLRPDRELERRIRDFISAQLGRVLPAQPARGLEQYYEQVVLGSRALEAYEVLRRHRRPERLPVLDVGAGLGSFVLLSNKLDMTSIGVEPGEREVDLARERAARLGIDKAELFLRGIGEDIPVDDRSVSAVLLHDVLEHVRDWRAVLHESNRVLAPGGVMYVKSPSYSLRFVEPHYLVFWIPLLPRPLARRYLRMRKRDVDYFEHLVYLRRGPVLRELGSLGLELSEFPRLYKLAHPEAINRDRVRRAVELLGGRDGAVPPWLRYVVENRFQSVVDVVANKHP